MIIKDIRFDASNRIILNGNKLMWAIASDVQRLGSCSDTLADKFNLYCDIRKELQITNANLKKNGEKTFNIDEELHKRVISITKNKGKKHKEEKHKEEINKVETLITIDELKQNYMDIFYNFIEIKSKNLVKTYSNILEEDCYNDILHNVYISVIEKLHNFIIKNAKENVIDINRLKTNIYYSFYRADDIYSLIGSNIKIGLKIDKCTFRKIYQHIKYEDILDNNCINIDDIDVSYESNNLYSGIDTSKYVISNIELHKELRNTLKHISTRELIVLSLRFGLRFEYKDYKEYNKYYMYLNEGARTLENVGNILGIKKTRVRQIEVRALNKLRNPIHDRNIKDYIIDNDFIYNMNILVHIEAKKEDEDDVYS